MGTKLNLKNVRVGWLNVFEKAQDRTNNEGKLVKGKYQVTVYLDKDDAQINKIDKTVLEVLTESMGSAKAAEKWMEKNFGFGNHADKCAFRDLAERDKPIEGLEEGIYFKAASHKSPRILTSTGEVQNEPGGKPVKGLTVDGDDIEGQEVYGGCYANISVDIYWFATHKVLMVDLLGIRFREDGPAFGNAGETANDDDLSDDDEKPSRTKRRPVEDDEEEEERPRKKRRNYEDDEE
ncbi:single-stranded DNA-binding protein [Pantoea phage AH01]|nr:single-stranded DNA-binding protein [Pantoea phage AH01]